MPVCLKPKSMLHAAVRSSMESSYFKCQSSSPSVIKLSRNVKNENSGNE